MNHRQARNEIAYSGFFPKENVSFHPAETSIVEVEMLQGDQPEFIPSPGGIWIGEIF